jgi:hypothetical protein
MKRNIMLAAALLAAGTLLADSKDDVTAAAKALGGKDNYSWKSVMEMGGGGNFRPGPTEGKTDKTGLVWISRTFNDNTIETVIKGKKGAIKTEDGWQSAEEAAQAQGPVRFFAGMIATFKAPADEAQDLAEKTKSLKSDEGVISGDLTEEGAKARLTFGRGRRGGNGGAPPEISNAKGTAKFWIKDGTLAKYESHVTGTRKNQNGDDMDIDITTTVEIKDVGTTQLAIPEEATKKLE